MLSRKEKNELKKQIGELLKRLGEDVSRKEKNDAKREIGSLMKRLGEAGGVTDPESGITTNPNIVKPLEIGDETDIPTTEKLKRIKLGAFLRNFSVLVDSALFKKAYNDYYKPLIESQLSYDNRDGSLDKRISTVLEKAMKSSSKGITNIEASYLILMIDTLKDKVKETHSSIADWEKPHLASVINDLQDAINRSIDKADIDGINLRGFDMAETGGNIIGDQLKLVDKRAKDGAFIIYPRDEFGDYRVAAYWEDNRFRPSLTFNALQKAIDTLAAIRDSWLANTGLKTGASVSLSENPSPIDVEVQYPEIARKYKDIVDVTIGKNRDDYREKLYNIKTEEEIKDELLSIQEKKKQLQNDEMLGLEENPFFMQKQTFLKYMEDLVLRRYNEIVEEKKYIAKKNKEANQANNSLNIDLKDLKDGKFDDLSDDDFINKITEISDAMGGDIEPLKEPVIRYIEKRLETA